MQASDGKSLFNITSALYSSSDRSSYEAVVIGGTQLCSRRLLQEIIYCVGGVSVFFPLLTQIDKSETDSGQYKYTLIKSIMREKLAAEVIELIASVLDGNLSNQQQMHLLSGFSILGFLFQSIPPQQLNLETLSSLKNMFGILTNCGKNSNYFPYVHFYFEFLSNIVFSCYTGVSDLLIKEAISRVYLNPQIWVYANYEVQRDLYMFLIQYFENDGSLLPTLCHLPRIIDIIRQCYWDKAESRSSIGSKPLLHPITKEVIGERPRQEEVRKIRLLLLSVAEMGLRYRETFFMDNKHLYFILSNTVDHIRCLSPFVDQSVLLSS